MELNLNGKHILLKGIPSRKLKVVEGEPSPKLLSTTAHLCLIQVQESTCLNTKVSDPQSQSTPDFEELKELQLTYKCVFEDPVELPPLRGVFDHSIPLLITRC